MRNIVFIGWPETFTMAQTNVNDIKTRYLYFENLELLYSMQPRISSEKTIYILYLNAQNPELNKLGEQWINILSPLIKGAPVIYVLGKVNNMASLRFDEVGFMRAHKLVKKTMYMSVHTNGSDEFMDKLREAIEDVFSNLSQIPCTQFRSEYKYSDIDKVFKTLDMFCHVRIDDRNIQNGILSPKVLHTFLKKENGIKAKLFLGITRELNLSSPMKGGAELFPMLCDGNEKISVGKVMSENALHYIFRYIYLPMNVIHRLVIEMRRDLDVDHVWYSGAVFRNESQQQTAYIHRKGTDLHIYVDTLDPYYNLNEYLSSIQSIVRAVNSDMNLSADEYVTCREGDKEAEIDAEELRGNLEGGIERVYIGELKKFIDLKKIGDRFGLMT